MSHHRKSKSEKEREKIIQDRLQLLLTRMLKDDDNKYCVDCDSKGPRWASWNLGLFLCIRCAGIHRNLGVHISKVRSVNLDSWTPVQVSSMQLMGNSRARAVYESNLPDGFVRPQNDQALEQFIRAKYEKKKYIAKEYVPEKPSEFPDGWQELIEAEKQKKDLRKIILPSHKLNETSKSSSEVTNAVAAQKTSPVVKKPVNNVQVPKPNPVSVAQPPTPVVATSTAEVDLLGLSLGNEVTPTPQNDNKNNGSAAFDLGLNKTPSTEANSSSSTSTSNKAEDDFFNSPQTTESNSGSNKMSNDSIMALFGKSTTLPTAPVNNNMFGVTKPQQQMGVQNGSGGLGNFGLSNVAPAGGINLGVNPQSNPFLNSGAPNQQPPPQQSTMFQNQQPNSNIFGGSMKPAATANLVSGNMGLAGISPQTNTMSPTGFGQNLQNQFSGLNLGSNSSPSFGNNGVSSPTVSNMNISSTNSTPNLLSNMNVPSNNTTPNLISNMNVPSANTTPNLASNMNVPSTNTTPNLISNMNVPSANTTPNLASNIKAPSNNSTPTFNNPGNSFGNFPTPAQSAIPPPLQTSTALPNPTLNNSSGFGNFVPPPVASQQTTPNFLELWK